jgi:hypothetical protein
MHSDMKKIIKKAKLELKTETVRQLVDTQLTNVVGGTNFTIATSRCTGTTITGDM